MDSIYSRKRINIPKIKGFYTKNNNKNKKILTVCVIVCISVLTFYSILKAIDPIFDGLCIQKAKTIATEIVNAQSSVALDNIDYKDIVSVVKDEANNTNILKTDVVVINKIASDVALEIEKELQNLKNEEIRIPIGALTGNKYLAGMGPGVKIKIIPTGNVTTELKTEFQAQGINQTMYRIYLELKCDTNILTPYKTIHEEIVNQVLLVETLIVGDVPQTYYNLEGLDNKNAVDIIE